MATKKMSDKDKLAYIKHETERALREVKFGENRGEVLGSVTMNLCMIMATIEYGKDDKSGILFIAAQIANEVQKKETKPYFPEFGTQLQLGETMGVIDEQKGSNPTKKSGK